MFALFGGTHPSYLQLCSLGYRVIDMLNRLVIDESAAAKVADRILEN